MKQLNETFEDKDFEELKSKKGNLTWRQYILKTLEDKKNGNIQKE